MKKDILLGSYEILKTANYRGRKLLLYMVAINFNFNFL